MLKLLFQNGLLKRPQTCPSCGKRFKMQSSGKYASYTGLMRCSGYSCGARLSVLQDHPILLRQGGYGLPLARQGVAIMNAIYGVNQGFTHVQATIAHRRVREHLRTYVLDQDEGMLFGGRSSWTEVEADECTFGKHSAK
eukprot:5337594-Amphidinium_carterae.1